MEAAHAWSCSAKTLSNKQVSALLASLSARSLYPSASDAAAVRVGKRCVDKLDGVMAVAMKVPRAAEAKKRRLCRQRFCARSLTSARSARNAELSREFERVLTAKEQLAIGGFAASKIEAAAHVDDGGDWYAACVPLSCLGHDDDMRSFIWWLYWLRLAHDLSGSQARQSRSTGFQPTCLPVPGCCHKSAGRWSSTPCPLHLWFPASSGVSAAPA